MTLPYTLFSPFEYELGHCCLRKSSNKQVTNRFPSSTKGFTIFAPSFLNVIAIQYLLILSTDNKS